MGFVGKPPANVMRSDPATRAAWAALPIPLRECGEIAGLRLSGVLSDALRQAEEQLLSKCTQALTRGEREAILDAAEFAHARRECLVADFLQHFEKSYVRACLYKPTIMSGYQIDFDSSQLKIVEHDLLDDSLHPGEIVEAIQHASWHTLRDLTMCFARLLGDETINPNDIPLSPKLIEAAVSDATREQPWRHDAKYRLVGSLRRVLAAGIGHLYRDLAEHMYSMARQADVEVAAVSTPSYDQGRDRSAVSLPELEVEMNSDPVNVTPCNEVVELALAVARDEVARRQVERLSPLDLGEVVCLPDLLSTLPDPMDVTAPLDEVHPIAQVASRHGDDEIRTAQAGVVLPELQRGTWLVFRERDGDFRELKLSWISPRKSLYLMTNRQGERALSIGSEDLAAAFRDGRARIIVPLEPGASASVVPRQYTKKTA